jgi:uncharacterized membrane protein YvlD (DUF360 family)
MRQYLWQSLVDLVALVLALLLVAILSILKDGDVVAADVVARLQANTSLLPAVLVFSIILTAIHWFVRPLLLIFFGGWLMRSFGLFALILDILLFSIAILLAPVQVQATAVPWWAIPVAAVLYDLFDFVLVQLVGLNRPLLSYGVEIGLANTPVGQLRRWFTPLVYGKANPIDALSTPALIRVMLEQLGPTYIRSSARTLWLRSKRTWASYRTCRTSSRMSAATRATWTSRASSPNSATA